jgi:alpha-galactosidase
VAELVVWGHEALRLSIAVSEDNAPCLVGLDTGDVRVDFPEPQPLVEILASGSGHIFASKRLVQTQLGASLRYVSHVASKSKGRLLLDLHLQTADGAIAVTAHLTTITGSPVLRAVVTVTNVNAGDELQLLAVASWAQAFGTVSGAVSTRKWRLRHAVSDWLAEGRWQDDAVEQFLPRIAHALTSHTPRGSASFVSKGTWSTGEGLPVAVLHSDDLSWAWQVEHNGPWRFELGELEQDGYFALSGPTDLDHQWSVSLAPGMSFTSVPVSVALGSDPTQAVAALTHSRRSDRRPHPDNERAAVVFNDYMNTLNGDPSTDKLMPLIDAAAAAGAEIFCIDAGWYADDGGWWDAVGQWSPSRTRFPQGLDEVTERITALGMTPGLWLEPEVVGVRSPMVEQLPREAFLSRGGEPLVEQGRLHLDLRHPAARHHLDNVISNLIRTLGIGYFKLDYNIDPGPGTDYDASSVGAGLLEHNRAYQAWLDGILDAHPGLVLENCASGGMRADQALLSRLQLQSTSDQQDPLLYPPIAAAAPMLMVPEQAANWAYPQPDMSDEEIAFTLATSVLGRFYLSGRLDLMGDDQFALVRDAVSLSKQLRDVIAVSTPFWPLGLPGWADEWLSLGLDHDGEYLVTVWNRPTGPDSVACTTLDFPGLRGGEVEVEELHPLRLATWATRWSAKTGQLEVRNPTGKAGARVFRVCATP